MATIQYVGAGAISGATGAPTVVAPAGIVNGDLLLLLCESANQAISVTSPAGWTEIGSQATQATGTAAGLVATRLAVFYKFTTGTETNVVLTAASNHMIGRMVAFRNVNRVNPFINTGSGATAAANTTGPLTLPEVTTTVPDSMVVFCVANSFDGNNIAVFNQLPTNANLTSITERIDSTNQAGNGGGLALWTSFKSTVGATGTSSITLTAQSAVFAYLTIALRPKARRFSGS